MTTQPASNRRRGEQMEPDWAALDTVVRRWLARRAPSGSIDDLVQETLLRVHRTLPDDVRSLDAWALTAARSVLADALRAAARRPDVLTDPVTLAEAAIDGGPGGGPSRGAPALGPSPEEHLRVAADHAQPGAALESASDDETAAAIAHCVGKRVASLPAAQRDALIAVTAGGRTQAQAAAEAGVSVPGMKSRVQRGAGAVRAAAESCCHFELDGRGRPIDMYPRVGTVCTCGCADRAR